MRVYLIPWGYVMAKRNPSSDDAPRMDNVPKGAPESQDLGSMNPSSDDATTDLGAINAPVGETVDLGKLPMLAKFKKFKKGAK